MRRLLQAALLHTALLSVDGVAGAMPAGGERPTPSRQPVAGLPSPPAIEPLRARPLVVPFGAAVFTGSSTTASWSSLLGALQEPSGALALGPHQDGLGQPDLEPWSTSVVPRGLAPTVTEVRFRAPPSESEGELGRLAGIETNRPLSPGAVRRAVKVLYQLDRFETVVVRARSSDGGVQLDFHLPPKRRVRSVHVTHGQVLPLAEIEAALGLSAGRTLDARILAERRIELVSALRRKGYRGAAVGFATHRVDDEGGTDFYVRIDEGPPTVVRRIEVQGHVGIGLWRLMERIGLRPGDIVDSDALEKSLARIRALYVDLGYWDARLEPPDIRELKARAQGRPLADVVLYVESGPRVSVRFKGHHEMSRRWLDADALVLREMGTGPSSLTEARDRMLARYRLHGHWRAKVEPALRVTPDGRQKEILFSIHEGPRSRVGRLSFPGSRAIAEDALHDRVQDSLRESLAAEFERPGADPELVAHALGGGALPARGLAPYPSYARPGPDRAWPLSRRQTRVYVERAYRVAAEAVADFYRSRGFQTVKVRRPKIEQRSEGRIVDVEIEVDEGVQWRVEAVAFSGHEQMSADRLLALSGLEPARRGGEPLSFFVVEEGRRALLAHYRDEGFLYASVATRLREVPERGRRDTGSLVGTSTTARMSVDVLCREAARQGHATCPVQVVFVVQEGPRVHVRDVVVRGLERTAEALVRGEVTLAEGDVLGEVEMTASRANLLRLGVFDRVSVRPLDEELPSDTKDVLAQVRERTHRSFEVGAGASTEEGLRVFASVGHANLFGRAVRMQAIGKVNIQPNVFLLVYNEAIRDAIERFYDEFSTMERIEREAAVGFAFPRVLGLPRGFSGGVDLSVLRRIEPTYAEDARIVSLVGHYKGLRPAIFGRPRPLTMQLRADLDWSDVRCNEALTSTPTLGRVGDLCTSDRPSSGTSIYVSTGPRVSLDLRDDALDPKSGVYAEFATTFAKGLDPGSPDHLKLEGQLNGYVPVGRGGTVLTLAFVARRIFAFGSAEVPINRRYFAGGQSTVRGYPEQSLFPRDIPRDEDGLPFSRVSPGGAFFMGLKSELRFPVYGSVSAAGFFDIGDLVLDARAFSVDGDTPMGAGGGLRVATPVGPISVDFAVPINPRGDPGEQSLTLHFAVRSF